MTPGIARAQERLETAALRFEISPRDGAYTLADKTAGAEWRSGGARFGEIAVTLEGKSQRFALAGFETAQRGNARSLTFHPIPGRAGLWVRVDVSTPGDGRWLDLAYEAAPDLKVEEIRLLDEAFPIRAREGGYVVVPVREGLLIPAGSGLQFRQRFGTYDYQGCHMAMAGLVKNGAALLVTWTDPYTTIEVRSTLEGGAQTLTTSAALRKSARSLRVRVLGKGDYVTIAKAYREVARERGYLVTWENKLAGHPERARYFGASNVKLWSALNRRMNEESTAEISARVNWTFEEVAQVAEHLKRDLKLDKVLFGLGGWIRRGYDNQHPDILPAAPELGGNEKLAECAQRVEQLGYLLALHDNYQDIYRDSPSWDEKWIAKKADGSLLQGGRWAGGRAFITCSRQALELARRPQNLTAVRELTQARAYFIDTTYAAGLGECFDPAHPLTKLDDMRWKQELSDYARGVFGSFGSECGREWALPHADFFEGLTGVSGTYYHNSSASDLLKNTGGSVIPLFEMVYRDTIAMYGKYGYDIRRAAEYVLHHIAIGRPLNYHSMPNHVYWTVSKPADEAPAAEPDPALFVRGDNGWTEGMHPADRFLKNTHEVLSPLNELTARAPMTAHEFLGGGRRAQHSVFGEGAQRVDVVVNMGNAPIRWHSKAGGEIELPPYGFVAEAPEFAAFYARNWNGQRYSSPPLFTLRSLDGRPLAGSRRIAVYHGFGDAALRFGGKVHTVTRDAVLTR